MATITELSAKVEALEKAVQDLQGAISRLGKDQTNVAGNVAKVTNEVNSLKAGLSKVQKDGKVNTYGNGVSKY